MPKHFTLPGGVAVTVDPCDRHLLDDEQRAEHAQLDAQDPLLGWFYLNRVERGYPTLSDLTRACGYLLPWATDPAGAGVPLREWMDRCYAPYTSGARLGVGTVHEDGRFSYPGDPDEYPLVRIVRPEGELFIYRHGDVAFRSPEGWLVGRMD
jgi:hypothetical protein